MEFWKLASVGVGFVLGMSGAGAPAWAGSPTPVQGPPADFDDIYRSEIKESNAKISNFEFQLLDFERERKKKESFMQEAEEERKAHPDRQPTIEEKHQLFKASQRVNELKMETMMLENRKKAEDRRIAVFQQLRKEATTVDALRARREALGTQLRELLAEQNEAWDALREASKEAGAEYRKRLEELEEDDSGAAPKAPEQLEEERQAALREMEKKLAPERERIDALNERMQLNFTETQIIGGLLALDSPEDWLKGNGMGGGSPGMGEWGGYGGGMGMGGFGGVIHTNVPAGDGGIGKLQSTRKVKRVRNPAPAGGGGGGDSGSSGTAF